MLVDHKFKWGAEIVLLAAIVLEPGADAITADVAKKCNLLMGKKAIPTASFWKSGGG
jgi:hypothetical protein